MRPTNPRAAAVLAGALALALAGPALAQADEDEPRWPSAICLHAFAEAAAAAPSIADEARLDEAVRTCTSVDDWAAAAAASGSALLGADPMAFLEARCLDGTADLAGFASCYHLRSIWPPPPGGIVVEAAVSSTGRARADDVNVAIILDTSGSMLERVGDVRRIDIAKSALSMIVTDVLEEGVPIVLRTFGGSGSRREARCGTRLAAPLAPLEPNATLTRVETIRARKATRSPIAASMAAVADDLAVAEGRQAILMITDGDESCGGDMLATIERLRTSGVDLRLDVVGFALDDEDVKARMAAWAEAGGGSYFDATSADELGRALSDAVRSSVASAEGIPFEVLTPEGGSVAHGRVGAGAVEVPAGRYDVRVMLPTPVTYRDVAVSTDAVARIELPATAP